MKTTVTLYHSKVSINGVTHREGYIMASCKSEPKHIMDCERFVSYENDFNLNNDLQAFIKRLKTVVYEDGPLEVIVIDNRNFSLPLYV